jgi:hypothetical protein
MADKRVYNLTDVQSAYAEDLFFLVDAGSFTEAKKIKAQTIAPRIGHLEYASEIDPDTYYMRINNGGGNGGVETKLTITNLLRYTPPSGKGTEEVVDVPMYASVGKRFGTLTLRKFGKLVTGIMEVTDLLGELSNGDFFCYEDAEATEKYIIPEYIRPKHDVWQEVNTDGGYSDVLRIFSDGTLTMLTRDQNTQERNFMISYVTE